MGPNTKPSERMAVIGKIDPQSTNTTVTSTLASIAKFGRVLAIISAGALGSSATLDAKLRMAVGSGGTPTDVPNSAITQLTKAGSDDNKIVLIELNVDALAGTDYTHLQISATVGTAASLVSAVLIGLDPRYPPASPSQDISAVDEIVSVG